jgi:hypothetical protein
MALKLNQLPSVRTWIHGGDFDWISCDVPSAGIEQICLMLKSNGKTGRLKENKLTKQKEK